MSRKVTMYIIPYMLELICLYLTDLRKKERKKEIYRIIQNYNRDIYRDIYRVIVIRYRDIQRYNSNNTEYIQ